MSENSANFKNKVFALAIERMKWYDLVRVETLEAYFLPTLPFFFICFISSCITYILFRMITYYIKPLIVESIRELEFRDIFFHKLKPFGVLASIEIVKESKEPPY